VRFTQYTLTETEICQENQSRLKLIRKINLNKTRNYLKLNYKYPEYSIGFRWVLHARCGYKFDACVVKAAKMIEEDYPERCPCCYRKNSNPRLEHLVF